MVLVLSFIIVIPVLNANSVDPDQTPRSVASDLGLHCLPMSLLWDARHKWATYSVSQTRVGNKYLNENTMFFIRVHSVCHSVDASQGPEVIKLFYAQLS